MERQEVQHEEIEDVPYLLYQFSEFDSDVFIAHDELGVSRQ